TTGRTTMIRANPDLPSALALICAAPGSRPVTTPSCVTVATRLSLVDQKKVAPLTIACDAVWACASKVSLLPAVNETESGATMMAAIEPAPGAVELAPLQDRKRPAIVAPTHQARAVSLRRRHAWRGGGLG